MTEVIVLNGGSSSGKSGIVRCLQAVLPDPWPALGTDTLVEGVAAMARAGARGSFAVMVHRGVVHDLEVDTAHAESMECPRAIAVHVR